MLSGKCDVRVQFHQQDKTYRHGEKVSGEVIVDVNKSCKCDGLVYSHEWHTHGRGNKDWDSLTEEVLYKGTWQPGSYRYPFSFVISNKAPASYHGDIVNVDNYIKVCADIPWAFDPKDEVDFIVESESKVDFKLDSEKTVEHSMVNGWAVCFVLWVIFLILGGMFSEISSKDFTSLSYFITQHWVLTCAAVGLFLSQVIGMYRYKQLTLMGPVTARMKKSQRDPRSVHIELEFKPKVDMVIKDISVDLIRQESATSGSGTNESTYSTSVTVTSTSFDVKNKHQTANTGFAERAKLTMPEKLMPAFRSINNEVTWAIELTINTNHSNGFTLKEVLEVDECGNLAEIIAAYEAEEEKQTAV